MTKVQRDALIPSPGMMIFNTTTGTIQGYHKATAYGIADQSNVLQNSSFLVANYAQSFIPGGTGDLLSVTVMVDGGAGFGTLNIRSGAGTGGPILSTTPITIAAATGATQELQLSAPITLTGGSIYTFEITSGGYGFKINTLNSYASGTAYQDGILQPSNDMYFITKMNLTYSLTKWNDL